MSSVQLECGKALEEAGFSWDNRHELEPEFKPLVFRAILSRARATNSLVDYTMLSHLLRTDGWVTSFGLSINLAEVQREIERHLKSERSRPLPSRSTSCKSARDPKGYYSVSFFFHYSFVYGFSSWCFARSDDFRVCI